MKPISPPSPAICRRFWKNSAVAAEIIAEVMAIAGGTHDDVLGLPQAFAAE